MSKPASDDREGRELVRQARDGSVEALNELLARCAPLVESFLRKRVGKRLQRFASIADMRQDVLLQAVDSLKVLPDDATYSDFKALLLRNAHWAILKTARRRTGAVFESEAGIAGPSGPEVPSPTRSFGSVTRADDRRWIHVLLDELDEPLAAVARRRMKGATFGAIAAELGIGEDAARKRFLHACRKLRAMGGEID